MLLLFCILIPIVVGVMFKLYADRYELKNYYGERHQITNLELGAGVVVVIVVALLVTVVIGPGLARDSAINGYKEFYNGSVTQVRIAEDTCERDGSCTHDYNCDPYEVKVVDKPATEDSPEISHYETRYHKCPYATKELDYVLDDNLGRTIVIGGNHFESNPREWRGGSGIPGDVPRQPPERWLTAKRNVANGFADGVTGVFEYSNFILASDSELYQEYDGKIDTYQKAGLLPKHTANMGDDMMYDYGMRANKVQAVGGLKVPNMSEWQDRFMRFNAALGSKLQGDMHIVLVPTLKVSNPDDYITALKAYWTSLGKWSISKNGIILAIGVSSDGSTVEWSRAATGMPIGNGAMLTALKIRLVDQPLDPDVLIGNIGTTIRKSGDELKVNYDQSAGGMIGDIVFTDFPFQRACMKCEDADDKGTGYVDLRDLVPVSAGAKILMFFVVLAISVAWWASMLYLDPFRSLLSTSSSNRMTRW